MVCSRGMLTPPLGVLQAYGVGSGVEFIPPPQGNWYMFATLAQAQQVLALAQKNFPTATLALVSGTKTGNAPFMMLPSPNPLGLDVWIIQGTVPLTATGEQGTLVMADYAGDVWDRGPLDQASADPRMNARHQWGLRRNRRREPDLLRRRRWTGRVQVERKSSIAGGVNGRRQII